MWTDLVKKEGVLRRVNENRCIFTIVLIKRQTYLGEIVSRHVIVQGQMDGVSGREWTEQVIEDLKGGKIYLQSKSKELWVDRTLNHKSSQEFRGVHPRQFTSVIVTFITHLQQWTCLDNVQVSKIYFLKVIALHEIWVSRWHVTTRCLARGCWSRCSRNQTRTPALNRSYLINAGSGFSFPPVTKVSAVRDVAVESKSLCR